MICVYWYSKHSICHYTNAKRSGNTLKPYDAFTDVIHCYARFFRIRSSCFA